MSQLLSISDVSDHFSFINSFIDSLKSSNDVFGKQIHEKIDGKVVDVMVLGEYGMRVLHRMRTPLHWKKEGPDVNIRVTMDSLAKTDNKEVDTSIKSHTYRDVKMATGKTKCREFRWRERIAPLDNRFSTHRLSFKDISNTIAKLINNNSVNSMNEMVAGSIASILSGEQDLTACFVKLYWYLLGSIWWYSTEHDKDMGIKTTQFAEYGVKHVNSLEEIKDLDTIYDIIIDKEGLTDDEALLLYLGAVPFPALTVNKRKHYAWTNYLEGSKTLLVGDKIKLKLLDPETMLLGIVNLANRLNCYDQMIEGFRQGMGTLHCSSKVWHQLECMTPRSTHSILGRINLQPRCKIVNPTNLLSSSNMLLIDILYSFAYVNIDLCYLQHMGIYDHLGKVNGVRVKDEVLFNVLDTDYLLGAHYIGTVGYLRWKAVRNLGLGDGFDLYNRITNTIVNIKKGKFDKMYWPHMMKTFLEGDDLFSTMCKSNLVINPETKLTMAQSTMGYEYLQLWMVMNGILDAYPIFHDDDLIPSVSGPLDNMLKLREGTYTPKFWQFGMFDVVRPRMGPSQGSNQGTLLPYYVSAGRIHMEIDDGVLIIEPEAETGNDTFSLRYEAKTKEEPKQTIDKEEEERQVRKLKSERMKKELEEKRRKELEERIDESLISKIDDVDLSMYTRDMVRDMIENVKSMKNVKLKNGKVVKTFKEDWESFKAVLLQMGFDYTSGVSRLQDESIVCQVGPFFITEKHGHYRVLETGKMIQMKTKEPMSYVVQNSYIADGLLDIDLFYDEVKDRRIHKFSTRQQEEIVKHKDLFGTVVELDELDKELLDMVGSGSMSANVREIGVEDTSRWFLKFYSKPVVGELKARDLCRIYARGKVLQTKGDGSCGAQAIQAILKTEGIECSIDEIYNVANYKDRGNNKPWMAVDDIILTYQRLGGKQDIAVIQVENDVVQAVDFTSKNVDKPMVRILFNTMYGGLVGVHYDVIIPDKNKKLSFQAAEHINYFNISDNLEELEGKSMALKKRLDNAKTEEEFNAILTSNLFLFKNE